MTSLPDYFPDEQTIVDSAPEILAGWLLAYLNARTEDPLSLHNISMDIDRAYGAANAFKQNRNVRHAMLEAWSWLEREGLVVEEGTQAGWFFLSRRARQIITPGGLASFRHANALPREFLHPKIASKVWNTFLQGEYDTAVFQALKEVEVAVRAAGGFAARGIGVPLMRKAFDVTAGPLTAQRDEPAERQALSDLFAGAIGWYKNPSSHRPVPIGPEEAAEMIIFGSHLLKIVDDRASESSRWRGLAQPGHDTGHTLGRNKYWCVYVLGKR